MSKAKDIINGWSNYFQFSNDVSSELVQQRATICSNCNTATHGKHAAILPDMSQSKIQGYYCDKKKGGCNCPISTIIRSKDYKCIKGKW